jgi:uncharacterized membrane protein (DUF485 family)
MENPNLTPKIIEKMINLEQGINASSNKFSGFEKTDYYQRLSMEKKKEYKQYLKNKNKKKVGWLSLGILPLFMIALMNMNFTGNAIKSNIGESNIGWIQVSLAALCLIVILTALYFYFANKSSNKTFKKHSSILEEAVSEKFNTKR